MKVKLKIAYWQLKLKINPVAYNICKLNLKIVL